MTLGSSIKMFVENIVRSARIISPRFADYRIDAFDFYNESGEFDESFKADVIRIVQDEIKIQMTEVSDPGVDIPKGSNKTNQAVGLARNGVSLAQNPTGIVSEGLKRLPQGVLVAFAISMVPIIFKELTRPGSSLELRWKRIVTNEINAFNDRQTQRNTQLSYRQIIATSSNQGFLYYGKGKTVYNNKEEVRGNANNIADSITRTDHAKEIFGS